MNQWDRGEFPDGQEIGLGITPFGTAVPRHMMLIATALLAPTLLVCRATAADGCHRGLTFAEPVITSAVIPSSAYGDFNEDGQVDVVVMLDSETRIIALNRGGIFQPMPAEELPLSLAGFPLVAATDVNRDGHLDLIYRRYNSIQVALGRGDGSFTSLMSSTLSNNTINQWRMIDFDHDGLLDFVDFDFNRGGYTFVQSKGDGTFEQVGRFDFSSGPIQNVSTTAGDFDGDGNIDVLMVATELPSFSTSANFGLSDGKFHFVLAGAIVDIPGSLQPVDVDGDGAEELVGIKDGSLVIMRLKARQVSVERIPVAPQGTTQVMTNPMMLDVNGDGIRDLVFGAGRSVGVIWGTGGNHFGQASYFELSGGGNFTPVDVDHDGVLDIAATSGRQGLPVLYGAALKAGKANANRVYPVGFTPASIALADIDGDGLRDLVVTGNNGGTGPLQATVLFGDGKSGFPRAAKPLVLPATYSYGKGIVGDFDGDGHVDLAISSADTSSKPIIAFGTVSGFPSATLQIDADSVVGSVFLGSASPPALIVLKGDDVQLVAISSGRSATVSAVYHRPAGAAVFAVRSDGSHPAQIAVATLDKIVLVTRTIAGWQESILANSSFVFGMSGIASADFNGDGRDDFVIWGSLSVFFARADGSYQQQNLPNSIGSVDSITPTDFDGDGVPDLVLTVRGNYGDPGKVQVLRNVGGDFQPYAGAISGAPFGAGAAVGDVDGDGRPEVLIPSFDGVEVLSNICLPPQVRVAAVPANPAEGSSVTLLIHATSITPYAEGLMTISEDGKVLGNPQARFPAFEFSTASWISPRLTAGTHTFRIQHDDPYSGSSSIDFMVTTKPQIPRRRAARP
jgi:hypothetical protein